MNTNKIKGDYNQIKGKIKGEWGKLTDDDLTYADGKIDQLVGRIQHLYGTAKEEIQKKIDSFTENSTDTERKRSNVDYPQP